MDEAAASYVYTVQHLIETCLTFHLSEEECVEALFKHANIKPAITSTVWRELQKVNKEFFEMYARDNMERRASQDETTRTIEMTLRNTASTDSAVFCSSFMMAPK